MKLSADTNEDSNADSQRPPWTCISIASRSGVASELGDRLSVKPSAHAIPT